jgi:two-component system, chemotaxis family, protein-glutamate methylesterase/glutaminase
MSERPGQENGPYRLVIVDDSPYHRLRFGKLFGRSEALEVAGMAADGEEGVALIAAVRPDVVLLDLTMPRMDGFAVLRWVMAHAPLPVVVCSSRSDRESVFKALELGAVDYIIKPGAGRDSLARIERILLDRVVSAAGARVGAPRPAATGPMPKLPGSRRAEVIAIAASTGGPAAIQRLVRQLPAGLTVPIVVAQHMPPGFTRLFAERLERQSHYAAVEARDGAALRPGTIVVAPGGQQMRVVREEGEARVVLTPRAEGDLYAPSADMLFTSIADAFGPAAVAVILTGMGDDGSRGARAIKRKDGTVLVETSESALIYGMPRAAVAAGCARSSSRS